MTAEKAAQADAKLNTLREEGGGKRRNPVATFMIRYGVLAVTVGLFIMFSFMSPRFASARNIFVLIGQGSIIGLLALGLTNIVVVGEFDISFAAVATLAGVLSVVFIGSLGLNMYLVWILCVAIAVGFGLWNAFAVVKIGMPSFIATIALMALITGVNKWITGGSVLYYAFMPPGFKSIGRAMVANLIPSPVLWFAVGAIAFILFLDYTYIGRYFYAVGGSREAARRVGIKVQRVRMLAFVIMGLIAGVSGIVMASMFGVGNPVMGDSFLFPAIIATFLGAIFLREGLPNAFGTVVAAILLAIIANGLTLLGLPLYVKEITEGVILLAAVGAVSTLKPGGIPGVKIG